MFKKVIKIFLQVIVMCSSLTQLASFHLVVKNTSSFCVILKTNRQTHNLLGRDENHNYGSIHTSGAKYKKMQRFGNLD